MSEEAMLPAKRGRKPAAATEKVDKPEPKKRARKELKPEEDDEGGDEVEAPKRGRGRPKGATKKKAPASKGKSAPSLRGKSKKAKDKSSVDDEVDEEEDED